jgi:hypothetical protein
MCGRECFAAFLAAITTPSALGGCVVRMADDVAFVKPSAEAAGRIGTAVRQASSDFHTCLLAEEAREVQDNSQVAALPMTFNNTSLKKHQEFPGRRGNL